MIERAEPGHQRAPQSACVPEGMEKWKNRAHPIRRPETDDHPKRLDVRNYIVVAQHVSLGFAGTPGRENHRCQVVRARLAVPGEHHQQKANIGGPLAREELSAERAEEGPRVDPADSAPVADEWRQRLEEPEAAVEVGAQAGIVERGDDAAILGQEKLARQLRLIVRTKDIQTERMSPNELRDRLSLTSEFVARKTLEQARLYSLPRLKQVYRQLLETDLAIKTGKYEPELALNILIAELCQGNPARLTRSQRATTS